MLCTETRNYTYFLVVALAVSDVLILTCVCHFQLSQLLEAIGVLVNFFASFMALVRVFAFGLMSLYTVGVMAIS